MSSVPPYGSGAGGPDGFGRRIEEAIELIELEVRHAAAYVNDAVIPQVRTESISALRTVADSLRKFADRLDERTPKQPPQPPESPKS
jgi:predicted transcriptional regulator